MLAEGFITAIGYKERKYKGNGISHRCAESNNGIKKQDHWQEQLRKDPDSIEHPKMKTYVKEHNDQNKTAIKGHVSEIEEQPYMIMFKEEASNREPGTLPTMTFTKPISVAVPIPITYRDSEMSLDMYRSGSCTSIYKNYPDLQIGGDNVGDINSSSSAFLMDLECDTCDGPLLLSIDIPLGQSPLVKSHEKSITTVFVNNDEAKYKSITLPKLPLSNSMINNYMEKKMMELYKQYLEDTMTKCASPVNLLSSSFLMNSIEELSLQLSQEHNMNTSKAREMVLTCLLSVASGNSSEISTPNLQISGLEAKKNSDASKKTKSMMHNAL